MRTIDYILIGIVLIILGGAAWFIRKAKKSGKKCIGCPDNCACSNTCCNGGCHGQCHEK